MFSFRFCRTDVETVIHSDSGFATVAYLRIKGAALEEKSGFEANLAIPPLLEGDFANLQTLLRGHHSAVTSSGTVSEPVLVSQFASPSRTPFRSRKGDWVAVGNVHYVTSQAIEFEEEAVQCFHEFEGSPDTIEEIGLLMYPSPAQELRRRPLPVHARQCLPVFNGLISLLKCNIHYVLWNKPTYASVRRCGSSCTYEGHVRLLCVFRTGPSSTANRTSRTRLKLLGTSEHWAIFAGGLNWRTHVRVWPNRVDPSQPFATITPRLCDRDRFSFSTHEAGR